MSTANSFNGGPALGRAVTPSTGNHPEKEGDSNVQ
jgi:hypothetical protein